MQATPAYFRHTDFPELRRAKLETLQINLGYRCNQACVHCHVDAGPNRTEEMSRGTVDDVLAFLSASKVRTLDITGGAPELNPNFRYLVSIARSRGVHVIDRCNLTILLQPGQEDLAEYLATQQVEVTASLPCYLPQNVDRQRGKGVFSASIEGLRKLNALGYGQTGPGLLLNLVYNPQGPQLPPPQERLEADYRRRLFEDYGILFNRLYTLTNMPIARFRHTLVRTGGHEAYMQLLRNAFDEANLEGVMCRTLLSVDWLGYVYDCDFNQMLGIPLSTAARPRLHLSKLVSVDLEGNPIQVADHCYGCTAGQGSGCSGALRAASTV
ncbi:MAG: arsenosugar biosynthesis radical SAM protein ArsS [Gammaproteobacteria bacterium]|nr:arsenosugar biosynthesis radical SAM protein ArsS [Gammaproteobacteria bacterium]